MSRRKSTPARGESGAKASRSAAYDDKTSAANSGRSAAAVSKGKPIPPVELSSDDAEQLASLTVKARQGWIDAGRALHDEVGPLLAAAGLHLQLLRGEIPGASAGALKSIESIQETLDRAMEEVRRLSQSLLPSAAERGGLKMALAKLAEEIEEVDVMYQSSIAVPSQAAAPLYAAAYAAMGAAVASGAERVLITVEGMRSVITIRVEDDGSPAERGQKLALASLLARHAGLSLETITKKSTIVSIRYAF